MPVSSALRWLKQEDLGGEISLSYTVRLSRRGVWRKEEENHMIKCIMDVLAFLLLQSNTITKKQFVEKRVYLAYSSILLFIIVGSQDRNSAEQDSGGRILC